MFALWKCYLQLLFLQLCSNYPFVWLVLRIVFLCLMDDLISFVYSMLRLNLSHTMNNQVNYLVQFSIDWNVLWYNYSFFLDRTNWFKIVYTSLWWGHSRLRSTHFTFAPSNVWHREIGFLSLRCGKPNIYWWEWSETQYFQSSSTFEKLFMEYCFTDQVR